MNLFNVLHLAIAVSLTLSNPDVAIQPRTDEFVEEDRGTSGERPHQPFETPDRPVENAVPATEAAPQEDLIPIPENEREVPQGQF